MTTPELDRWHMHRALELAARGQGAVEPNPMVGCVIAHGTEIVGEGWHRRFGGPHAEVEALAVAADQAQGATLYVTLAPCNHHGQTPPCTEAILRAGVRRVVAAMRDPNRHGTADGLERLAGEGVEVECGVLEIEAHELNAPYLKLVQTGRPWIIAKWAMTLDGKLATRSGDSKWISSEASRAIAHALRGRVDAILVGRGTVEADNPLLTARPPGPRVAARIVLDSRARLAANSQLVRTARETPVVVAANGSAAADDRRRLEAAGCEVLVCRGETPPARLGWLLDELGRRRMTNLLVEGGPIVLGAFFDPGWIDEVHAFVAPKLIGGAGAPSPLGGNGLANLAAALALRDPCVQNVGGDAYIHGRVNYLPGTQ
jgi:diaminohydroxyphosphoribosylaminopyrimidine deaminase/5-amino-6-(5-phosphoribosylamino)uracil reductase